MWVLLQEDLMECVSPRLWKMAPCCECWGSGAQTAAAAHRVTDWKKLILRSNNNAGVVPRGGGVEWVGRGG